MIRSAVLAMLLSTGALPLAAAEIPGRYVLEKVEDGYLRLDRENGAVSHCSIQSGQWECRAVKDDTALLTQENARLRAENEVLKIQLANTYSIALPSDHDIAKLKSEFGKLADSFAEFVNEFGG